MELISYLIIEICLLNFVAIPNQVKMLTLRWQKAVCTQYRHAGVFSSQIPFSRRCLNPLQLLVTGFHKRPGHRATEPTSLPEGGCGQRQWISRKLLARGPSEFVGAVPAAGKEQVTKAVPDCRTRIRLGKWGCGWRLMVNREIADWRLRVEKQRKRLRGEKKAITRVSVSHFPIQECVEEQGGHIDQKKSLREEGRQGLAVPGDTAGTSVYVKGKRL